MFLLLPSSVKTMKTDHFLSFLQSSKENFRVKGKLGKRMVGINRTWGRVRRCVSPWQTRSRKECSSYTKRHSQWITEAWNTMAARGMAQLQGSWSEEKYLGYQAKPITQSQEEFLCHMQAFRSVLTSKGNFFFNWKMTLSECHLQSSPRGWHQDCSKLGRRADEKLASDYKTNIKTQEKKCI